MAKKFILVTGGAGYIGGHMAGILLKAGHQVVIFDNLSTGVKPWIAKGAKFMKGDLLNQGDLNQLFSKYPIEAVIHFAAKIVVPESMEKPELYYRNNVGGTVNLLSAMQGHGVRRIVFSSTAAVYGNPKKVPVTETSPTITMSPYGESKLMVEKVLHDMAAANRLEFTVLRYFNVAGWDTSRHWPSEGRPIPTHLISNTMKALGGDGKLMVCGTDYKTHDGTGVRDYIHVVDLCQAHLLALKAMRRGIKNQIFNLGNGQGFSVFDVIKTTTKETGLQVPHQIAPRRPGDVGTIIASFAKARKVLGWNAKYDLKAIIKSEWERRLSIQKRKIA